MIFKPQHFSYPFRAMACDNVIELYANSRDEADRAAHAAIAEVLRIEAKYSRYRDDSVVSTLNFAAGKTAVTIDSETAQLLGFAEVCYQQSGGLFDITSGVLRRVWNFKSGKRPSPADIAPLLPLIAWASVVRTEATAFLPVAGMEIDFGGFGKEYAADRAAAVLLSYGIAHGFVNLGGDVVVTGPHADGSAWELGIHHPRDKNKLLATMPIASGAVATSGDYERYFDFEGRRYSHILNPKTGESIQGLQSITVLAPSCLVAGSISTIAMLKDAERDVETWLKNTGVQYLAVGADGVSFHHP